MSKNKSKIAWGRTYPPPRERGQTTAKRARRLARRLARQQKSKQEGERT